MNIFQKFLFNSLHQQSSSKNKNIFIELKKAIAKILRREQATFFGFSEDSLRPTCFREKKIIFSKIESSDDKTRSI
jgi:hypothetical protein